MSPVMKSSDDWDHKVKNFWLAVRLLFRPQINKTAGTHIHVAPWKKKFTLKQAQTIAFACCYYEPYIISFLPRERRDNKYCRRNTRVPGRMGSLYNRKTSTAIAQIASDIKKKTSAKAIVDYIQGGVTSQHRYVLWNFQGLLRPTTGTIEFRGGRHMRGQNLTRRWIAFVIIFTLFALSEVREPDG